MTTDETEILGPRCAGKNLVELFRFLANMQNSDDTIASIAERC